MSSSFSIQSFQMPDLVRGQRRVFVVRAMAQLRDVAPESKSIKDEDLTPIIEDLVARAQDFELNSEHQAFTFILAAWYLGVDLDTKFPAIIEALSDSRRHPEDKRVWLQDWTVEMLRVLEEV